MALHPVPLHIHPVPSRIPSRRFGMGKKPSRPVSRPVCSTTLYSKYEFLFNLLFSSGALQELHYLYTSFSTLDPDHSMPELPLHPLLNFNPPTLPFQLWIPITQALNLNYLSVTRTHFSISFQIPSFFPIQNFTHLTQKIKLEKVNCIWINPKTFSFKNQKKIRKKSKFFSKKRKLNSY